MRTILFILILILSAPTYANESINWSNFFIGHAWLKNTSGVLYFSHDFDKNINIMCEDLKENPNRITMIDQESLEIHRIKDINSIPPSYKDSKKLNINEFKDNVSHAAENLKKYCLKVNLAPVVDGQKGNRQYSSEYNENYLYASAFSDMMRKNDIIPTWKHFPGLNNILSSVYKNPDYKHYYKNIYGEGVIDLSTLDELIQYSQYFKDDNYNLLMFSIAIYPNIINKPIIFSPEIFSLAKKIQPNSLYIPDDLSELNLNDEEIIEIFKNFDLLMYTSPKDVEYAINVLNKAFERGSITEIEIKEKIERQNRWRQLNNLATISLNK